MIGYIHDSIVGVQTPWLVAGILNEFAYETNHSTSPLHLTNGSYGLSLRRDIYSCFEASASWRHEEEMELSLPFFLLFKIKNEGVLFFLESTLWFVNGIKSYEGTCIYTTTGLVQISGYALGMVKNGKHKKMTYITFDKQDYLVFEFPLVNSTIVIFVCKILFSIL